MANFKKFLWTLAALPLLVGCSDDSITGKEDVKGFGQEESEGVYMTVQFQPYNGNSSRSFTDGEHSSNDGTETGFDSENEIKSVLIVLATYKDTSFVACAKVLNQTGTNKPVLIPNTDNTIYQAKAKFNKTAISSFYKLKEVQEWIDNNPDAPNPPVRLFLYCNPTDSLVNKFKGLENNQTKDLDWTNWTITLPNKDSDIMWKSGNFLMTNKSMAVRYLPYEEDTWNLYTQENNPFDLSGMNNMDQYNEVDNSATNKKDGGSIQVHRMAARFDFRDGSQPLDKDGEPLGNGVKGEPFTYNVMVDANGGTLVKATIINMSLVNMLNEEYFLERVSTGTTPTNWITPYKANNTNGYQLLAPELPWFNTPTGGGNLSGNYVVTPKAGLRGAALTSNFGSYYFFPFFEQPKNESGELLPGPIHVASRGNGWFTTDVSDIFKEENGSKYPVDNYGGNYRRWRYVTENTFTGGEDNQVNSSSTGVVFRTQLKAGEALTGENHNTYYDQKLAAALNNTTSNGPILYYLNNSLYCSFEHLQYAALMEAGFIAGAPGQTDSNKNPLLMTEDGVYYNQHLDKSASLYGIVFGDGGVGEVTFHLANGTEVTYADYELNEDGSIMMANGKPVLAPQVQTAPNYLHSLVPHMPDSPLTPDIDSPQWAPFRDAVVDASATIYEKFRDQKYGWGYWNYYYYWNRHNDNGQAGVMAPMEFAVVRNNVYKLAVTTLKRLGHPRIPENDPDDPEPTTKDEVSDLYMTVTLQVVPWVVRINNIEF